ncbi:Ate1 protein [Candida orthopsilosis Co 90-125]|uniref:arginyltransferase n=1 Tax=Candida orthopsilosis (strain 90-125) TaxID=1136231 RepID=H8WZ39_CANO9|nr:Ate1 protein [Candida orthopsilosis Co 90-125]CCG21671.1 Ate1 protein [Candida orthopsilosis Co 90-125]
MIFSAPLYIKERHCGYCNDTKQDYYALESQAKTSTGIQRGGVGRDKQSIMVGSSITSMTCQNYDELMNQGFRRSGSFLYKSDLLRTCCRLYTIRTSMSYFKPTKKQRKAINKFIKEICPDESQLGPVVKNSFSLDRMVEAQVKSTSFKINYGPSKFTKEKYELYKKYQVAVHNDDPDDITEKSFTRFLCDSPFTSEEKRGTDDQWESLDITNWSNNAKEKRIGPTHACYYLHDKLIAISVLDFLPSGVSSIYFIWDPDYAHLSLGTISGINELQMCQALGYDWYYLGYYVEDCDKMNYKAKFGGEILDVCSETYYPMEDVKPYLKNGRLFVIGIIGDTKQGKELDYEATGHTKPDSISEVNYNAAEDIFGGVDIYANAKKEAKKLLSDYDIGRTDEYKLPQVMPGLIPLSKIQQWLDEDIIDDDTSIKIDMFGGVHKFQFGNLNHEGRGFYVDCVRLFGLKKMKNSTMILQ